VIWGARNRVRTRHGQLVAVLGLSVMAEFACLPAGATGDSALSTVLAGGELVVVVTAERLAGDVMEGDTWVCSVRERVSSLATSADCVLASVMAVLDARWYPAVPEVSSRQLSVYAALKWSWNVASFLRCCFGPPLACCYVKLPYVSCRYVRRVRQVVFPIPMMGSRIALM
jgi:hypothetical protein